MIEILPSVKAVSTCKRISTSIQEKEIILKCIDTTTQKPVAGCNVMMQLNEGEQNGGHDSHTHISARPLQFKNLIPEGQTLSIPVNGLKVRYQSPEPSGDVELNFQGFDPKGNVLSVANTIFKVRSADADSFQDLNHDIFGFFFDLENMSHQDGVYGMPDLKENLKNAVSLFIVNLIEGQFPNNQIPFIESEGASLPLGGLFDYKNNWSPPHCSHRNGKSIDISFSAFDKLPTTKKNIKIIKNIFLKAMNDSNLFRNSENTDHWHFDLI